MMTQNLNLFILKAGAVVPPGQFEILWAHVPCVTQPPVFASPTCHYSYTQCYGISCCWPNKLTTSLKFRVAISFSKAWKWKVKVKSLSRVWLWATPWTAAYQAPPSMGFSRQEYWSGVPLPSLMLVSTVQKNELAIHTYIPSFLDFLLI